MKVDRIVVTYTDDKDDIGAYELNRRDRYDGWLTIGSHKVVRMNGTTEQGRVLTQPGKSGKGCIDVAVVGVWPATGNQLAELEVVLSWLNMLFPDAVVEHNG